jgi:hypothetical protein
MNRGIYPIRSTLAALEQQVSRRSFVLGMVKGAGLVAAFDRFGPSLFAQNQSDPRLPYTIYSAIGDIIIPVDDDPGWATFEPGITNFGVDVFVRQVLLGGIFPAFLGFLNALNALNEAPVVTTYGPRFLEMSREARVKYFGDILTGQFENDGYGDVLGYASGLALISTKATFFSNYPLHLAVPGEEYQVRPPSPVKTGWDIMGYKGPVGPQEESELRAKFLNTEELPGIDPDDIYP